MDGHHKKIKRLLKNKPSDLFLKYFYNTSWMYVEQFLRIFSGIFVSIYIARFLGPEDFGTLAYILAILAIFMTLSRLGMESILVRELVRGPKKKKYLVSTVFWLMLASGIFSVLLIAIMTQYLEESEEIKLYIILASIGLIFQAFMVIDYNFQAKIKVKYSSIGKSLALILGSIVKVYLVLTKSQLLYIVIAYGFDMIWNAFFLYLIHTKKKEKSIVRYFKIRLVKPLMKSSWPMALSALSIILYMRVDQIMIQNLLDSKQLGLYAAAIKIYEGWLVIPFILTISLLPAIMKIKKQSEIEYEKKLILLTSIVFWMSVGVAIISYMFGEYMMNILFGVEYIKAHEVLNIVMWTSPFTAIGSITMRYLTIEYMEKKIVNRTLIALFLNILLNFLLIPVYGINGAAGATLISLVISNYLIDYSDKNLKQLRRIKNKAILLQLR